MSDTLTVLRSAEPAAPTDLVRRFYRPADVVRVTGASKSTIFAALQSGQLEGYKRGASWFIPVQAVDVWIRGAHRSA